MCACSCNGGEIERDVNRKEAKWRKGGRAGA